MWELIGFCVNSSKMSIFRVLFFRIRILCSGVGDRLELRAGFCLFRLGELKVVLEVLSSSLKIRGGIGDIGIRG